MFFFFIALFYDLFTVRGRLKIALFYYKAWAYVYIIDV